jgi:hypothetical protein
MRSVARILLAVLLAEGAAAGQDSSGGIKVGPLLSFAGFESSSSINHPSNFLGLTVGLFYARKISPVFSIQPELHFAIKGVETYDPKMGADTGQFNYLEIPLLLNIRSADGILEFFTGPYVAFLVSHTPLEGHIWTSPYNKLKSNDVGACLGVRVWLRNTSFELQLLSGFINILPHYRYPDLGHYNTTLVFQVGYKFLGRSNGGRILHH